MTYAAAAAMMMMTWFALSVGLFQLPVALFHIGQPGGFAMMSGGRLLLLLLLLLQELWTTGIIKQLFVPLPQRLLTPGAAPLLKVAIQAPIVGSL